MVPDTIEREITIAASVDGSGRSSPAPSTWALVRRCRCRDRPPSRRCSRAALGGHGTALGGVEVVEPPHRFAYRWTLGTNPTGIEPVAGNSTLVELTLSPSDSGTRLRLVESGFASLSCSEEEKAKHVGDNVDGWAAELAELAAYAQEVAA